MSEKASVTKENLICQHPLGYFDKKVFSIAPSSSPQRALLSRTLLDGACIKPGKGKKLLHAKGRSDGSSMFSRAKCSKQLRVALVISYSSSSLEWLLAGRVAGPQTLFRCQYLRRGVETIPLEIAKEFNLSITLFWGIKPILSFFSIPTLLFIGGSSDGWHISVTIVEQGSRSL